MEMINRVELSLPLQSYAEMTPQRGRFFNKLCFENKKITLSKNKHVEKL